MASYNSLLGKLNGRQRRKLANNTYLELKADKTVEVILHQTAVWTYYPDGSARVSNGNFYTVTSKDRINNYAPDGWSVHGGVDTRRGSYSDQTPWRWTCGGKRAPYHNGDVIMVRDEPSIDDLIPAEAK